MTRLVMEAFMIITVVSLLWFMMKIGSHKENDSSEDGDEVGKKED